MARWLRALPFQNWIPNIQSSPSMSSAFWLVLYQCLISFSLLLYQCADSSTLSSHLEPLLFVTTLVVFLLTCLVWDGSPCIVQVGWALSRQLFCLFFFNSVENLVIPIPAGWHFYSLFRKITWLVLTHRTINSKLQLEGLTSYWAPAPALSLSFSSWV